MRPTDPRYSQQKFLQKIGDLETIWNDYSGRGVRIVIYDDGVESTHEDLAANYDSSKHFKFPGASFDARPNSDSDGHGTSVAGIIGATANNGVGGTGIAWGARLTGVDFLNEVQFYSDAASDASIRHARHFDVMSNSWGRTPGYGTDNNENVARSEAARMNDAFRTVVEEGRDGRGTVIVQAAGNEADDHLPGIMGNANGDSANATRYTASVAGTDLAGRVADYSNWGTAILVSAPADNLTTDLTGSGGYDRGSYFSDFDGTSAATPVVSGVVALMLEANPNLGWRDVQNILATSAAHTGSAFGAAANGHEVGAWYANGATNWNGGGMTVSPSYGFGMVDAYAAVRMAEIWTDVFRGPAASGNEIKRSVSGSAFAIEDLSTVRSSVNVTQSMFIEDITVTIDIFHTWTGDLKIRLEAPDGSIFDLFRNELGGNTFDTSWSFGVTGALGMNSRGAWKLIVADDVAGDIGTVRDWRLDFYGSPVRSRDVYHFTDDFLYYRNRDTGRSTISDNDGGVDWLNLAAVTGVAVVDMAGGGSIKVGGTHWARIADRTLFENIVTGDGKDVITGNGADNIIRTMRGADTVKSLGGRDTVYGGLGADTINSGDGDDQVWGGDGRDKVILGNGNDLYHDTEQRGTAGGDTVSGGSGDDTIDGGGGESSLFGDGGDDLIHGGPDNDLIYAGAQYDTVWAGGGSDSVWGGNGCDLVYLEGQNDVFYDNAQQGIHGADSVNGGAGNDTLFGAGGNDMLGGDAGADKIYGGIGQDQIFGGTGNDLIYGGADYDVVHGGGGNDTVWGGSGRDKIYLEDGSDLFQDSPQSGVNGADTIFGGMGNDTILCAGGDDAVDGGPGDDLLTGGSGADTFIFREDFGKDKITDYQTGLDLIQFDDILWGEVRLSVAEVIETYASAIGGDILFDFGGNALTVLGIGDTADLLAGIFIS